MHRTTVFCIFKLKYKIDRFLVKGKENIPILKLFKVLNIKLNITTNKTLLTGLRKT